MKYDKAIKFFTEKHLWFSNNVAGRNTNQIEFADWLNIPAGTLSLLMAGVRHPSDENLHKLSIKLGPEIYDVYDAPRLMPDDPLLAFLLRRWFDWPETTRKRLADVAEQIEREESQNKPELIQN